MSKNSPQQPSPDPHEVTLVLATYVIAGATNRGAAEKVRCQAAAWLRDNLVDIASRPSIRPEVKAMLEQAIDLTRRDPTP